MPSQRGREVLAHAKRARRRLALLWLAMRGAPLRSAGIPGFAPSCLAASFPAQRGCGGAMRCAGCVCAVGRDRAHAAVCRANGRARPAGSLSNRAAPALLWPCCALRPLFHSSFLSRLAFCLPALQDQPLALRPISRRQRCVPVCTNTWFEGQRRYKCASHSSIQGRGAACRPVRKRAHTARTQGSL